MLIVQYGYIFLVLIFLLLFSLPKGSENKKTKISELGKYISYCTLSRAITITYSLFMLFVNAISSGIGENYYPRNIFINDFAKINTREMQFFSTRTFNSNIFLYTISTHAIN